MDSARNDRPVKSSTRKKRGPTRNGIWWHALIAIGIGLAGLVCSMVLLWWQLVESSNERHRAQQIDTYQRNFAAYFNGRIASLREQVGALAASRQTVEALTSYDRRAIAAANRSITELMGFARRVEIIPKGEAQVDLNAVVPISFAALDVIKRAEEQEFVGPEGVSLDQRNFIYAARPITDEGLVVGVLFVVLSTDYFLTPLGAFDPNIGRVRIEQTFAGSQAINIFQWGRGGNQDAAVSTPLNSYWTLVFEPSDRAFEPVAQFSNLLASFAVALGMLLGGVSLAFSTLGRKMQRDANALTDLATRLLRGRSAPNEAYRLPLFEQVAGAMMQYSRAGKEQSTREARARQQSENGSVEDLLADEQADEKRKVKPKPKASRKAAAKADGDFLEVDAARDPSRDAVENFGIEVSEQVSPVDMGLELDAQIFRSYDIRGIVKNNLTEEVVYWIGRAFAAEAADRQQTRVAVGRDGRTSSEWMRDALTKGLTEGGMDVLDIGCVPTPLLYFATHALDTGTGIMITGSHNPPEYNGLKMVLAGETLAEDRIQSLRQRIVDNELTEGDGSVEEMDLNDHYVDRILEDVVVAQPMKVVVDCGNGAAGLIAPRLLEELGCEVVPLYCDVDGNFPNHHPDPADPHNLEDLITVVKAEGAALGLAFDGDGDRLGLVTGAGEIVWPDKLLMLFAQDIVGRNPGADIIYDVKCSRHLNSLISEQGGRPIMWKTGHSHIKAKLKETGALLGGEFSGHICFGERWYGFDDAIYSAARLLEIVGAENKTVDELFAQFPVTYSTPEIKVQTTENEKFKIVERIASEGNFGSGTVTKIDGVRVDFPDGWGLIRPSNTSPVLTLRFEADGQAALDRIRDLFATQLSAVDPSLKLR